MIPTREVSTILRYRSPLACRRPARRDTPAPTARNPSAWTRRRPAPPHPRLDGRREEEHHSDVDAGKCCCDPDVPAWILISGKDDRDRDKIRCAERSPGQEAGGRGADRNQCRQNDAAGGTPSDPSSLAGGPACPLSCQQMLLRTTINPHEPGLRLNAPETGESRSRGGARAPSYPILLICSPKNMMQHAYVLAMVSPTCSHALPARARDYRE